MNFSELKKSSLISIIIPAYNRAHLISETLDSIIAQSYSNWECLIVDDGSTDNTLKVLQEHHTKDKRIEYYQRDPNLVKGANTCRNIGLEKARGDYIVFFDSDDLMTPNHLEVKINAVKKYDKDFVITRTEYFNADNTGSDKYNNDITASNYITQKCNWLTLDVIIKAEIAKTIRFNENLKSGQEYNYFCKLVLESVNACFIDKVVSLRRRHNDSIKASIKTSSDLKKSYFYKSWLTYLDIKEKANIEDQKYLLIKCINSIYAEKRQLAKDPSLFTLEMFRTFKMKGIYFALFILGLKFNRAYYFRKKLIE